MAFLLISRLVTISSEGTQRSKQTSTHECMYHQQTFTVQKRNIKAA
jgi:hypothetical protein